MLKTLFPNEVKVKITIDDIKLRSNLGTNKSIRFTKKPFLRKSIGFNQSHSRDFGDFKGFIQLIPGKHKSDKLINITGVDKVHLKFDCYNGSKVNGFR